MLHDRIQTLAEQAPPDQIDRYRWAAYSFRMPFWDWSQGDQSGDVPDFFMTDTVQVDTPDGQRIEIWNPLFKFDFKPVPQGFEGKVGTADRVAETQLIRAPVDAAGSHSSMAGIRKCLGRFARTRVRKQFCQHAAPGSGPSGGRFPPI